MDEYLHRCLSSIIAQTVQHFEAILIDDGSTDSSCAICKEFVLNNSNFTYFYQENAGLSSARNLGMKYAVGEYLSFIDPDDFIEPYFVESLYEQAKKNKADILCFGFKHNMFDEVVIECPEYKIVDVHADSVLKHFCQDWLLPQRRSYAWSKLLRREFIKTAKVKFNPLIQYTEDRNFCYKLLFHSARTVYFTEAPYFYFQHSKSITHSATMKTNVFTMYLNSYDDICSYWAEKGMEKLLSVSPIALIRSLQGAIFNTKQKLGCIEKTAEAAVIAFKDFPLERELSMNRLKDAISLYSDLCELDWGEQSKIWMFALSMLGGKEGIITWQQLYPHYVDCVNNLKAKSQSATGVVKV